MYLICVWKAKNIELYQDGNLIMSICFSTQLGPKAEDVKAKVNPFVFLYRFLLGVIASAYYVLVPIYMWLKDQIVPKGQPL